MAANGHKAPGHGESRESQIKSSQSWLEKNGKGEYQVWRTENPTQRLSYGDWKSSKHVEGLSLYYAALNIFNEPDFSDDVAPVESNPRPRVVRTQSAREPKRKSAANGNGVPKPASSAISSAIAHSDDLSPSSKRKRKARRKYLSEEIIASDGESGEDVADVERATPIVENATPTAPIITVNGRRKSSSRKPKKKLLSKETVSPDDEIDDPMVLDEVVTSGILSPLPVRSASKAKTTVQTPEPPRKPQILKLITRKQPKNQASEKVLDEHVGKATTPTSVATPPTAVATEPNIHKVSNLNARKSISNIVEDTGSAVGSPDHASGSTRRGLRTRRPAQQRPYFHDAQLFDDVEPDATDTTDAPNQSPKVPSRRVSATSIGKAYDDEPLAHLDKEDLALLHDEAEPEDHERRPKHFKGKGRAWKKDESDEDGEFTVAKKKAAKAAKAKAKTLAATAAAVPVAKKRGRPRKSALSDDIIRDDSDTDAAHASTNGSPTPSPTPSRNAPKKAKKPPRKSVLSAEIVPDSDSGEDNAVDDSVLDAFVAALFWPKSDAPPMVEDKTTPLAGAPLVIGKEMGTAEASTTPDGVPKSLRISLSVGKALGTMNGGGRSVEGKAAGEESVEKLCE